MIFGIGFPKTGTSSLSTALQQLGYRTRHHQWEVEERRRRTGSYQPYWNAGAVILIWPWSFYMLYAQHPDAKFILTTRDEDAWLRSVSQYLFKRPKDYQHESWLDTFGTYGWNEQWFRRIFRLHRQAAIDHLPADQLLLFDLRQHGWKELCEFLGEDVPATPYPHENKTVRKTMQNLPLLPDLPNTRCLAPKIIQEHPDEVRSYAELGLAHGDTACRVAQAMKPGGELWLFDFDDRVTVAVERLREEGQHEWHKLQPRPCSRKTKDSYCWPLLKMLGEGKKDLFDYVFLDGAHTFDVDGLAYFLLDRLLRPGGWLEFDDYNWTLSGSKTLAPDVYPSTKEWYTREQIKTSHVKLICDILVDRERYDVVEENRLFRKKA